MLLQHPLETRSRALMCVTFYSKANLCSVTPPSFYLSIRRSCTIFHTMQAASSSFSDRRITMIYNSTTYPGNSSGRRPASAFNAFFPTMIRQEFSIVNTWKKGALIAFFYMPSYFLKDFFRR